MSTLSDDINDFCFIDTETKALPWTLGTPDESVVTAGAYRYSRCAVVNVIQWAIGDDPVEVSAFKDFRDPTRRFVWAEPFLPPKLWAFHQRVLRGEAWYVPWNAAFDRLMMNASVTGFVVPPEGFIDGMVQAVASNLPAKLEGASRAIGRGGKHEGGKNYINMFTGADWGTVTPETHPQEWHDFTRGYGAQDVDELRAVFKATRPLPRKEWEEYWVSEKINDRGIAVDVDFADRCAAIAELNGRHLNDQITRMTGGAITKVTQRERIANWLYDRTPHAEARDTLVKAWTEEDDVTGENDELVPSKLSIAEDRLNAWRNFYDVLDENEGLTDDEFELVEIAEARATGASATPAKFQKIVDQHDDGRLKGQYVFNGAPQTGRYCVDAHTLVDTPLGLRHIVDLKPGDEVITHLGRAMPVNALIYKGREIMYRVIGPEGVFIDATLGHRLLTERGWQRVDDCFQIDAEERGRLRPGCEPLSLARAEHDPDFRVRWAPREHSARYLATGDTLGGAAALAWGLPLSVKNGRVEPDVREEDGSGPHTAARSRSSLERRGLHVRAPSARSEVAGVGGAAGALGGASHRRGQDEQRLGQPRDSYEAGAPQAAPRSAWQVVRLGERDVWDISVEGDRSYLAQGLVHHNSSRGVQVHNLIRASLTDKAHPDRELDAIELINTLELSYE